MDIQADLRIARAVWQDNLDESFGLGVADNCDQMQHVLNGAMRAFEDNKKLTNNPLFMLDEIAKLYCDFRGDPASAMLAVLDPEQNYAFSEHYLELPFDLSRVMFVTTANTLSSIPAPLLDRMEVIEFPGYIEEEKLEIATRYLIPRQLEENGVDGLGIVFEPNALRRIIREYTYEAGVRNLEREIGRVCRKIARMKAEARKYPTTVTAESIEKFLGRCAGART